MKQNITRLQLGELRTRELDKLHKFCNEYNYYVQDGNYKIPLLSIGQMIDFLSIKKSESLRYILFNFSGWNALNDDWDEAMVLGDELCDELWEAVKIVLEKGKDETI